MFLSLLTHTFSLLIALLLRNSKKNFYFGQVHEAITEAKKVGRIHSKRDSDDSKKNTELFGVSI